MSLRRATPLAALLWLTPLSPAAAQARWTVGSPAAANLWFHGLALLDLDAPGAFPLYAPGYASRPGGGMLRQRLGALRSGFQADSAFEVLHFLPLYFPRSTPAVLLAAVRDLDLEPSGLDERFGWAALRAALPQPSQRQRLAELAGLLEQEWRERPESFAPAGAALIEFEAAWRGLEAALAPYLRRYRLSGGLLLLSPALGPDGRLFEGDPQRAEDNVLAVELPEAAGDGRFLVVRELCFPAIRLALRTAHGSAVELERLSGIAAVRCGAMLLARYAPAERSGYESAWLKLAGRTGPFADAFPIPAPLARTLDSLISAP